MGGKSYCSRYRQFSRLHIQSQPSVRLRPRIVDSRLRYICRGTRRRETCGGMPVSWKDACRSSRHRAEDNPFRALRIWLNLRLDLLRIRSVQMHQDVFDGPRSVLHLSFTRSAEAISRLPALQSAFESIGETTWKPTPLAGSASGRQRQTDEGEFHRKPPRPPNLRRPRRPRAAEQSPVCKDCATPSEGHPPMLKTGAYPTSDTQPERSVTASSSASTLDSPHQGAARRVNGMPPNKWCCDG